ncbi:hypothetical protein GTZ99_02565 [Novosphingobium sp. FSY-8]|uniref:Phytanoyl-CoA dioxygenase PhyH n=1 Tax=Novosphingobium ovatum TaxID=1908523 RepID=A0ABW9XA86_9SPHN|nr:hypothetical protein [Novosphingobium ovatum]NBC35436.1 hypothetical protein [Novosphingobium ovatum]
MGTGFGHQGWVGLDHQPEAGVLSWMAQVERGERAAQGALSRLGFLARLNYAHFYIHRIRKHSNDPAWLGRAAQMERWLTEPLHPHPAPTERARKYLDMDYHVERAVLAPAVVGAMRDALFSQPVYNDPYIPGWEYRGHPDHCAHPMLYMDPQSLMHSAPFLAICANPDIITFCREVLGPAAAISWAWSWISNPTAQNYQNQNWHRDSSEPLNFIRIFVPLENIATMEDGPTALIPGTSGHRDFYDVRRFSDEELAPLQQAKGAGVVMADVGDVYFVNTFSIHKGVAPRKRRAILTLLASINPSHRTPTLQRLPLTQVPEDLRDCVAANRRFFRYLVR